jgi:hypothetical protein
MQQAPTWEAIDQMRTCLNSVKVRGASQMRTCLKSVEVRGTGASGGDEEDD